MRPLEHKQGPTDPLTVLADLRRAIARTTDPHELAQLYQLVGRVEAAEQMRKESRLVGDSGPAAAERAKYLAGAPIGGDMREPAHKIGSGRVSKALAEATASAGGLVVPVEVSDEIALAVRARSAVMALNPRVVDVRKELQLPGISSGATAFWSLENAALPVSEQTFAVQATLKPKELGVLVPLSNRLIRDAQNNPDLEAAVTADMGEVVALAADLGFIMGPGTGGQPLGIRNVSGLTTGPALGATALDYDDLIDAVSALRTVNAPFGSPGWVFHPRVLKGLQKLKDSTGRYLTDAGLLTFDTAGQTGTLLGYRFVASTQVPTNLGTGTNETFLLFGSDWQTECWIGREQDFTFEQSADAAYTTDDGSTWVSAFQNRQVVYRITSAWDIALRRPQFFTAVTGVLVPT